MISRARAAVAVEQKSFGKEARAALISDRTTNKKSL
jgi:hypothetical protein